MSKSLSIRLLSCAAALCFASPLVAQMHHVEAPENVTRSVGVYEWTGDLAKPTAARLIPVSLYIDGAFRDGGTYYARPVPLALLNGNIYSLEKAGVPEGTLTLDYARHLQSATSGSSDDLLNLGWFGYGTYATMPAVPRPRPLQSIAPPRIASSKDDDRPTFSRNRDPDAKPAKKSGGSQQAATVTATAESPDADPDRPHFSKPPATTPTDTASKPSSTTPATPASTPAATPSSTTASSDHVPDPSDDSDRPTLRHRDPKQAEADRKARSRSSVSAAPGALYDDPDRPTMQRGRTAGIGGAPAPQLSGMPTGLHQIVAVSDPANREPHSFSRPWASATERASLLVKFEVLARTQLASYGHTGVSQPVKPTATLRKSAAKSRAHHPAHATHTVAPVVPLTDEKLASYTLSYGGLPTFVYTATSATPAVGDRTSPPARYVALIAEELPNGQLQVALASVTDAAHLDTTPRLRLVDAVDPDWEHRGSLLFELRGHETRQFALYRVLSARATQIFVTNPTN